MRSLSIFLFCCAAFFLLKNVTDDPVTTQNTQNTQNTKLKTQNPKSEPFQYFAAQRANAQGEFDSDIWNEAMLSAKKSAQAAQNVQHRGANGLTPWEIEGPTNRPGRVNCMALYPGSSDTVLAGFATGGIFRSVDGGVQWDAVFDDAEWCAIGDITHAPSDPNIVYASTGDPQLTGYTINGVGIFKSMDGGVTWNYVGFRNGGVLSTLAVHPSDPNTLYVASMGNPFIRDNERGVYKSTDGGVTWAKQLNISDQAGCIDLVMNPQNPDILYASFWDRIRNATESIAWGPNAKIYKTTDGGTTWNQMTNGLPTGNNCRIGLAISQQNPDKVYAVYCDSTFHVGGLYKTTDGGQNWVSQSISGASNAYVGFGWYFGKLRLDPNDDEDVYLPGIILYRKEANQNTFFVAAGAHADIHEVIFAPNGKRYLGSDGGPYYHVPGQNASWTLSRNLPTTQFYKLGINPNQPTWYYGGAQDNGTLGGEQGQNWSSYYSKDGFDCHFHPTDPNVYWMASQNGEINMTTDGGQTWFYGSRCLNSNDRCSWNTPYLLSPHNPQRLYGGTYRVYTTFGLGTLSWGPISPDLTDGNIFGNPFHVITTLHESILIEEKLFAGTSDGNVWRRSPSGQWTNINGNLPDVWVTSIKESPTQSGRLYVTHSGQRSDSPIPHIHRSNDDGLSWVDISGDLPDLPVNDLLILQNHADSILLAATDVGVYCTRNAGQNWFRLGAEMPYVPVYELEYNPAEHEVAAATFGRSIWSFPADSILTQAEAVATFSIAGMITDTTGTQGLETYQLQGFGNALYNGAYQLDNIVEGADITVQPTKNDDPTNGINAYDLLLLQKHLLGTEPLTSTLKIIAADANNSGSITPTDITELRKLILGIYPDTLPKVQSWRFIPSDYTFSNPLNPFPENFPEKRQYQAINQGYANQDFIALKVGDIDGTVKFNMLQSEADERRSSPVFLQVENAFFKEKETKTVIFSIKNTEIVALQGALAFDKNYAEVLSIEALNPSLSEAHFYLDKKSNEVRFVLEDLGEWDAEGVLFAITFQAKRAHLLEEALYFKENNMAAQAFTQSGTEGQLRLDFVVKKQQHLEIIHPVFFPNPMQMGTSQLVLPEPLKRASVLSVYALDGQLIFQKNIAKENTIIQLQKADLAGASGVVFWKLGSFTGKLFVH